MYKYKSVSVIIPILNEENTIVECIISILNSDFPVDKLGFIIADGGSTDKTVETIKEFSIKHPEIKIQLVNNTYKTQGYGLNIAIENVPSETEIVVRADAHSIYPKNYIMDCVQTLLSTNADNVGGVMLPVGKTHFQKAIAFCMSHPLGVGNAKFHLGNFSGFVDTVYLGCFRKDIFNKIGLFDPEMTPNEDAELNLRILESGGKIYLNSNIRVQYFPRDSIGKLFKQYYHYGEGRCRSFKKHKKLISIRQIIPPLWVILTIICLFLNFFSYIYIYPLTLYLGILLFSSIYVALKRQEMSILLSPICFVVMHYAWGIGFLRESIRKLILLRNMVR